MFLFFPLFVFTMVWFKNWTSVAEKFCGFCLQTHRVEWTIMDKGSCYHHKLLLGFKDRSFYKI